MTNIPLWLRVPVLAAMPAAMIWMVFAALVPESLDSASSHSLGVTVVLAIAARWSFKHFVLGHW